MNASRAPVASPKNDETLRRRLAAKNRLKNRFLQILISIAFGGIGGAAFIAFIIHPPPAENIPGTVGFAALAGFFLLGGIGAAYELLSGKTRFDSWGDITRERLTPEGRILLKPDFSPLGKFIAFAIFSAGFSTGAVAILATPQPEFSVGPIIGFGVCAGLGAFLGYKSIGSGRALRAPRIRIELDRKARVGDESRFGWHLSGGSRPFASLLISLSCIEETVTGQGRGRRTETTDLWTRRIVLLHDAGAASGNADVTIPGNLPATDPETFNAGRVRKRIYWRVAVEARTADDDIVETDHTFEVLPAGFSRE